MIALEDIKDEELDDFNDDLADMDEKVEDEELDIKGILASNPSPAYMSEISRYLNDISNFPRLTQDEEVELAKLIEAGVKAKDNLTEVNQEELTPIIEAGQLAREKFINSNYKLVVSIAKRYIYATNASLTFLDLIQNGNLGLMKSVDRFEYRRGLKFSTFATWWIRQSIMREILNSAHTIRVPVHLQEWIGKINRLQQDGELSVDELAEALDITPFRVTRILQIKDTMTVASLDRNVIIDETGTPLIELIAGDSLPPDSVNNLESREYELIELMSDILTDREFYVISRRFGLLDDIPGTLDVIGSEVGVTRERIRQIEVKALKKLRLPKNQDYLKDLLRLK